MNQKYKVQLNDQQRQQLEKLISCGRVPARTVTRAHVLLKSDCGPNGPNWSYQQISTAFNVSQVTVSNIRKTYVNSGIDAAIYRKKPDRMYQTRLDGEAEAHLIALACGDPPNGHARWTLRLLQERMIQLEHVEDVSHETIRTTLKKTNLSLG
jgi:transposase